MIAVPAAIRRMLPGLAAREEAPVGRFPGRCRVLRGEGFRGPTGSVAKQRAEAQGIMAIGRQSSYLARRQDVKREWYVVDATDRVLGRLAVDIANVLMGKHRPTYTPHVDTGDYVIVINAHKFRLTGNKAQTMHYDRYTYHYGGFRRTTFREMMRRHPERVLRLAVKRMMPKTALGGHMLDKLKIYCGDAHPHGCHRPKAWTF